MLNKKDLKAIWIQKEGAIIGALWGLLSVFAALGLATTKASLLWYHKLLILPVYLSGFIFETSNLGWPVMLVPVLLGAGLGALVDMVYKKNE